MSEIMRSDALDKMFLGIYGNRNVNYDRKTVIINDDRIKKTFYSPTSIANVRYLIELTFTCDDVKFEDKKRGKNFNLTKDKIIHNTIAYFKSFGIDIPEVVNKTEIQLLARRLCNTIIERILPSIFSNIDVTKNRLKIETDDISLEFNKAVKTVKTDFDFDDFFEWLYADIKVSDVEKLFDSDFDKGECNYGVLVCSVLHNIFVRSNYVTSIHYCNLGKEDCTKTPESATDSFTELVSRFVNQVAFNNKNFISPYYYSTNKESIERGTNNKPGEYRIRFNACLPSPHFVPQYFYFMTNLDEKTIEEAYPDCKTSDMLNQKLTEKAIEQFREEYTDEIIQYYKNLFAFIEKMCSNFLLVDIEKILSCNVKSMTDFKETLSPLCDKNDIDRVWQFCEENGLNVQQSIRYIYCGIEEAMYGFLFQILDSFMRGADMIGTQNYILFSKPRLVSDIEKNLSISEIKKYTGNLRRILKSKDIDKLSEIRSKYSGFKWNTNKGFNLTYRNDSDSCPYFNKDENIYHFFKTTIISCCDRLNSN